MANNRWLRNSLVYLLIIIGVIVIFYTFIPTFGAKSELALTDVITKAKNQEISEIIVEGDKLTIIPRITGGAGGAQFTSRIGPDTDLLLLLDSNGVDLGSEGLTVTFKGSGGLGSFLGLMLNFLPLIFFGGLILLPGLSLLLPGWSVPILPMAEETMAEETMAVSASDAFRKF